MPRASKLAGDAKQGGRKSGSAAEVTAAAETKSSGAAKKSSAAKKRSTAARAAKSSPSAAAKATPAKRAKAAPKAGGDKFAQEQRALLQAERTSYEEQAASLKAEADELAQEMEPGDIQFDEESGEGGTGKVDRERDLALSAQARVAVDEIDHALQKLSSGTYGVCEGCGQPIPKARLKALPYARLCVACKSGGLSRR